MAQEQSESRMVSRCLAVSLVILLSLVTSGPAFAADSVPGHGRWEREPTEDFRVEFEKTHDEVRFTTYARGVEITVLDYFGHPVESAVIRLWGRSPIGLGVPGGIRKIAKEDTFEIVEVETVGKQHFAYRPKFNGLFKVQIRVVTKSELLSVEQEIGEELEMEEEARRLRRLLGPPR